MVEKKNGIFEITDKNEKAEISSEILNALPEWFGIPSSTQEYIENSKDMPFFAFYSNFKAIGFLAIKFTSHETAEIYVTGILKEFQRMGYGKLLAQKCIEYCKNCGYKYLQVKTLDSSNPDKYYAKTRKFYENIGFSKLECFKELWDKSNPCLIYIMKI